MKDTKQKILDAASALFLEGGAAALSVRAIAGRAEMSTIGIYSHFKGKQGILDALYTEAADMVSAAMETGNVTEDPKAAMMASTSAYIDFAAEHAAHYRLFFGDSDASYLPGDTAQAAAHSAYKKLLRHAALFLPEGSRPAKIQETALGFWALLHGFIGLTRHPVASHSGIVDWRSLILSTAESHVDAILAQNQPGKSD